MRLHSLLPALLLTAACTARESTPAYRLSEEPSPTGAGAAEPNLFTAEDGRVVLSWLEPVEGGGHALRFALRDAAGSWSPTGEVMRRSDLFVNWADFPSVVVARDGRLVAHWLQRNGAGRYAYEVRMAESVDGGASWSASVTPHRAGVEAEHGFVSMVLDSTGVPQVFFLDGGANRVAGATPASDDHEHGVPMALSTNRWSATMTEATKAVLDTRVCDCCQTASAMAARGPVVVFRDRSEGEIRDIAIVRRVDGAWTEPVRVHADDWQINACPVNGPAVVASGDEVAVAWFTGARDTAKVQLAFSRDGGATFGAPIRIDEGAPAGRVGLQWLDGQAYVSWLERGAGDTAYVKVRPVSRDGVAAAATVVSESRGARSSGFPRMTRLADGLLFAWTMPGTPSVVKLATLQRAP